MCALLVSFRVIRRSSIYFSFNSFNFFLSIVLERRKKIIYMQIGWCFDQMWFYVCKWLRAQKCSPSVQARPSQLKLFTSTLFSVGFEIESFIRSSNNTFFSLVLLYAFDNVYYCWPRCCCYCYLVWTFLWILCLYLFSLLRGCECLCVFAFNSRWIYVFLCNIITIDIIRRWITQQ